MTRQNTWQDKVAIVTGGSSGIGHQTALILTKSGARVLVTGRDAAKLSDVAAKSTMIETLQADSAYPEH